MATYANVGHILLKRGNTEQISSYTGPMGELTINTDTKEIHVHDNSAEGGYATLADQSYVANAISNASFGNVDLSAYATTDYVDSSISTISLTPGPQGEPGATGPTGPQGNVGPQGPQGIQGERGLQGTQGEQGIRGNVGPVGPEGPQGIQGIQGNVGEQGPRGFTGDVGPQGEAGPAGDTGPQGEAGPQGEPGAKGDTGEPGVGVPTGGTAGQVLAKVDGTDYNTEWIDQTNGNTDTGEFIFAGNVLTTTAGNDITLDADDGDIFIGANDNIIFDFAGGAGNIIIRDTQEDGYDDTATQSTLYVGRIWHEYGQMTIQADGRIEQANDLGNLVPSYGSLQLTNIDKSAVIYIPPPSTAFGEGMTGNVVIANAENTWEFNPQGGMQFPDGTIQTTAFTGNTLEIDGGSAFTNYTAEITVDGGGA